jgi:hypothetical protein
MRSVFGLARFIEAPESNCIAPERLSFEGVCLSGVKGAALQGKRDFRGGA